MAVEARKSEFVDAKSGVSARMTISAYENLLSSAELRSLKNNDKKTIARISDLYGAISAINGKIELVYEGELEGPVFVAHNLIGKAVRAEFLKYFPNPEKKKKGENSPYKTIIEWFGKGNAVELLSDESNLIYSKSLEKVEGLKETVKTYFTNVSNLDIDFLKEFLLHGLAEYSLISKNNIEGNVMFNDLLDSMLSGDKYGFEDEDFA